MCAATFQNRVIVCIASLSETQPWALSKLLSFLLSFTHYFCSLCGLALAVLPFTDRHAWEIKDPPLHPVRNALRPFTERGFISVRPYEHHETGHLLQSSMCRLLLGRIQTTSGLRLLSCGQNKWYHRPRLPAASRDSLPTPQKQESKQESHRSRTLQIIINISTKSVKLINSKEQLSQKKTDIFHPESHL